MCNHVTESRIDFCANQFLLFCCAGKDYPIQASTRDEMLVWITAIEDARVSKGSSLQVQLLCAVS